METYMDKEMNTDIDKDIDNIGHRLQNFSLLKFDTHKKNHINLQYTPRLPWWNVQGIIYFVQGEGWRKWPYFAEKCHASHKMQSLARFKEELPAAWYSRPTYSFSLLLPTQLLLLVSSWRPIAMRQNRCPAGNVGKQFVIVGLDVSWPSACNNWQRALYG